MKGNVCNFVKMNTPSAPPRRRVEVNIHSSYTANCPQSGRTLAFLAIAMHGISHSRYSLSLPQLDGLILLLS